MATSKAQTPLLSYVLHRYDWSETSLIVELFTRTQGRMVVIAKGAKRPTSQLRPVLLPFQPLHALLGKTPADAASEVQLLRSAEWAGGQPLLAAAAMFSGFYLNELLLKLLVRQDPHPALFDAYADTLAALATEADEAAALRAFELVLLRELGWLPELNSVTQTAEDLHPDQHYTLLAEAGIVPAGKGPRGRAWVALEAALVHGRTQGSSLGSTAALRAICAPEAAALRVPLRALLHYHLGPAPLRTRQVWQGVQRLAQTPNDSP
jgi:DNA repair protein RecO (recombination protein O)